MTHKYNDLCNNIDLEFVHIPARSNLQRRPSYVLQTEWHVLDTFDVCFADILQPKCCQYICDYILKLSMKRQATLNSVPGFGNWSKTKYLDP